MRRDRGIYWFAGLHEGNAFTIITGPAGGCVTNIHDRMPLILREDAISWWLKPEARKAAEVLEHGVPGDALECYPVTRSMSLSRNDGSDCIADHVAGSDHDVLAVMA